MAVQRPVEVLRIKEAVRQRDGYACAKCGRTNDEHKRLTGRQLDVHRTQPGSLYSMEEGVCTTLCRRCHGPQPRRKKGEPDLAKTKHLIGLPTYIYDGLEQFARENFRPVTWQAALIIGQFLVEAGLMTPEEEKAELDAMFYGAATWLTAGAPPDLPPAQ